MFEARMINAYAMALFSVLNLTCWLHYTMWAQPCNNNNNRPTAEEIRKAAAETPPAGIITDAGVPASGAGTGSASSSSSSAAPVAGS